MNRIPWSLVAVLALGGVLAAAPAQGSDDDDDDEHEHGERHTVPAAAALPQVEPVSNAVYQSECGSCHFAYPPGLLPARSWTALTADLPHHFGDDATLAEPRLSEIRDWLVRNAADQVPNRLSAQITRATAGQTPLRISAIPGLDHEHGEMPKSWISDNPSVRTIANCTACHTGAARGSFAESEISVPGHGRWDD